MLLGILLLLGHHPLFERVEVAFHILAHLLQLSLKKSLLHVHLLEVLVHCLITWASSLVLKGSELKSLSMRSQALFTSLEIDHLLFKILYLLVLY